MLSNPQIGGLKMGLGIWIFLFMVSNLLCCLLGMKLVFILSRRKEFFLLFGIEMNQPWFEVEIKRTMDRRIKALPWFEVEIKRTMDRRIKALLKDAQAAEALDQVNRQALGDPVFREYSGNIECAASGDDLLLAQKRLELAEKFYVKKFGEQALIESKKGPLVSFPGKI